MSWLMRVAAVVSCVGCATVPPPARPPPEGLARWAEAVDWKAAGDEAAQLLAGYLRVPTVNPPGNEAEGARWLAAVLEREGIAWELLEVAPGRESLLARLEGSGVQKPLCLVSHIDVVPGGDGWQEGKGPFSGAIEDGYVWGRGALDMKGMGVLELMTLVWLRRLGVPLNRDVVLLAVADEELESAGMRQVVERHWDRIGCSHAINEGGLGIRDLFFEGQTAYAISVAEKGLLWAKVIARGEAGHGSTPMPGRAPALLLEALEAILSQEAEPRLHPSLYELMRAAGAERGGIQGFVMRRPALVDLLGTGRLRANPASRAVLTDTCQLTALSAAGSSVNVVPAEAFALLDCRLLPGTRPEQMLARLSERVAHLPAVGVEKLRWAEANESPVDDPLFAALARHAVGGRAGVVAGPALSVGFTDSLLLRPLGVRAYGLVPFELEQRELMGMHGVGERVSLENVTRGLKALFCAVVEVSAEPAP